MFDLFKKNKKLVVGMVHLGSMPGTPLYNQSGGLDKLIKDAVADIESLQDGGIDAIMFGNENDRPYSLCAPQASVAAMSAVISAVRPSIKVPYGVNFLWDPVASIAIAVATGALFVREIFTGVYASDMGLWVPDCESAMKTRRNLGRPDIKLLFNINAEFATSLDTRPIALRARSVVFSSLADVILISGPITGQPVDQSDLRAVCEAVLDVPVFANTGVTIENVTEVLSLADGCIVGTHFKYDGNTWNSVDRERVVRFMERVNKLR